MGQGLLERAEMKREQTGTNSLPPSPDSWPPLPPSHDSWDPLPPSPDSLHQVPKSTPKDPAFKVSSKDATSKPKELSQWQIIIRAVFSLGVGLIPWVFFFMAVIPPDKCNGSRDPK